MPYQMEHEPLDENQVREMNDRFDELDVSGFFDEISKSRGVKLNDWSQSQIDGYRWNLSSEAEKLQNNLLDLLARFVNFWNHLAKFYPYYSRQEVVPPDWFKKEGEILELVPGGIVLHVLLAARSDEQRKNYIRERIEEFKMMIRSNTVVLLRTYKNFISMREYAMLMFAFPEGFGKEFGELLKEIASSPDDFKNHFKKYSKVWGSAKFMIDDECD